jgi:hypothetical protein
MRRELALIALCLAAASSAASPAGSRVPRQPWPSSATSIEDLAWLAGNWKGSLGDATIEERWMEPAGKTMMAVSRTVAGGRTVAFEFLRIEERPEGIVYIAHPQARPGTEFALTRASDTEAVFENPRHDNPKLIRYIRTQGVLTAETKGEEDGQPVSQRFVFQRVER